MRRLEGLVSGARARHAARIVFPLALLLLTTESIMSQSSRPRARDLGIEVGVFQPGRFNAITDIDGVQVGQVTVDEGDRVRTGVTVIEPHPGNPFRSRVPAAIYVGNGFGKLLGITQVEEFGELETPVLLTCTLCVWRAADAMVEWLLAQEGMESVRSINPVVGETNDGGLNDIRSRPIRPEHVLQALESARSGPVEEGSVGAGRGTRAFGWKGGIGTSSRVLPENLGGYTVGALVQSNFGGILSIAGAPVGKELGRHPFRSATDPSEVTPADVLQEEELPAEEEGSIMMVVATDAPLSSRNLRRLAKRAVMGLARTGSYASNGSGDYVIAFSTALEVRRESEVGIRHITDLPNDRMSGLFQAAVEATEEAIYNSLLRATNVSGMGRSAEALPIERTVEILRKYGVVSR
jgi:D-aminopeptidase